MKANRLDVKTDFVDPHDETVNVEVWKKGGDVHNFVVHAKEASDDAKNQSPKITVQRKLVPGDNKITDLIRYKDPEGQVSHVSLNMGLS